MYSLVNLHVTIQSTKKDVELFLLQSPYLLEFTENTVKEKICLFL